MSPSGRAAFRTGHAVRRGLATAAGLICLALQQAPTAEAQTFEEPPTGAPLSPPPPNSVEPGEVSVPPGSPAYLERTYLSALKAPLPAKIYDQGGIPALVPRLEVDANPHGRLGSYQPGGATATAANAFFIPLGTNGRSCATCHQPPSGMGVSLRNIKKRFKASGGTDPIFAPVDGANCPSAVPAAGTSGGLLGGARGKGKRQLADAYSLLLGKGLFRVFLPVPATAEFTVSVVSDAPGCNTDPDFNRVTDPDTGRTTQIVSVYRRPLISAHLGFKVAADGGRGVPSSVMWDGREPNLGSQAVSATLGHAQALTPPTEKQIDEIVGFQTGIFSAQLFDRQAGRLDVAGAAGGPMALSRATPATRFTGAPAFDEYDRWAGLPGGGDAQAARRLSIGRGQRLFNAGTGRAGQRLGRGAFLASDVGGLNDEFGASPVQNVLGSCGLCHNAPHAGGDLVLPPQRDIGIGGQAHGFGGPRPAADLPIFKITCKDGAANGFGRSEITTNDPGMGLVTGKCRDIGKKTVPQLRALAAREPFFSDGSAATLADVVDFYDKRFTFIDPATRKPKPLTRQEKQDLVNFLAAL